MYIFPHDLLQAQRDWYAVYAQLADRTTTSTAARTTTLRRRLHRLSVQVSTHPYWEAHTGRAPEARMALRQLARSQ